MLVPAAQTALQAELAQDDPDLAMKRQCEHLCTQEHHCCPVPRGPPAKTLKMGSILPSAPPPLSSTMPAASCCVFGLVIRDPAALAAQRRRGAQQAMALQRRSGARA